MKFVKISTADIIATTIAIVRIFPFTCWREDMIDSLMFSLSVSGNPCESV